MKSSHQPHRQSARSNLAGIQLESLEGRRLFAIGPMSPAVTAAHEDKTDSQDSLGLVATYSTIDGSWVEGDFTYGGVVNALDFNALASNFSALPPPSLGTVITQSVSTLPPIKGTYTGSYTSGGKKIPMTLQVESHTHTGHFSGNANFSLATGTFTGKVSSNLHIHIDFAGKGFSGTLTGATTHTGGQMSGSFSVTGSENGSGKFKVIKP